MLNENAKKWVAALRSGEYEQATGKLHVNGAFCCLGVACDLYRQDVGDLVIDLDPHFIGAFSYDGETDTLPARVRDWLGLYDEGGTFRDEDGDGESLYELNDTGCSFSEIADVIESDPQDLFR